jgi:hypothetical protein
MLDRTSCVDAFTLHHAYGIYQFSLVWHFFLRYYVEENTGESRWDPPPLPRSGAALSLLRAPSSASASSSLPPSVAAKQAAQAAAQQQQQAAAAQLAAKQQAMKDQALQQHQHQVALQQQQQQEQTGGMGAPAKAPPSRALGVLESAIRGGDVAGVRALVLADESLLQQVRGCGC